MIDPFHDRSVDLDAAWEGGGRLRVGKNHEPVDLMVRRGIHHIFGRYNWDGETDGFN